jgi:leader peptidase (prepilin peptidase)/N-methyltransferase
METITFALASAACLLGLAAGPVATALVQQVPHGRPKRLTPVCAGCGAARTLPLVALAPRLGRCRRCGSRAPAVEWVAELSLAVLWALVAFRLSPTHPWAVPTYLAFTFACVVLAVIDARTRLLPNRLTYPAFVVTTIGLALASLVEGDPGRLSRGLIAAAAVGGVFLLLAAVSHDGLGIGDVKFAPTLALALGWLSWPAVLTGLLLAIISGGVIALIALLVFRLGRKSSIPFGPSLALGALLAILTAVPTAG